MMQRFDEAAETHLQEAFLLARPVQSLHQQRSRIHRSCQVFREDHPGDSILNHTHTTEWIPAWTARLIGLKRATRLGMLQTVFTWWKWLFGQRVIDDNVLDYLSCRKLVDGSELPLVLRCNLQRHVAEHLQAYSGETRHPHLVWLRHFNVFVNRLPEPPPSPDTGRLVVGIDLLAAWFRCVCERYARISVGLAAQILSVFLDDLVSQGVLAENELERLCREYPMGKRMGVAFALAAEDHELALKALARPPTFSSPLSDHLERFLALKRSVGFRYNHGKKVLLSFDRFLLEQGAEGPVSNDLLARWRASRPDLSPASHRMRWSVVRQLCIYLRRYEPETYIPDPALGTRPLFQLRPRIIEPHEMKAVLETIPRVIPAPRWPLRPHTYKALLTLLYSCGLRISEALALRIGDVDLHEQIATIHETKFYKSRIVPFSEGLATVLRDYLRVRLRLAGVPRPESPFFLNQRGHHYKRNTIDSVWQVLLHEAGLGTGKNGPRLHDIRHSFATLRLLAWYREGVDVEAKLPWLTTYLGHAKVSSTQRYLTILPEIRMLASERFRSYGGSLITPIGDDHALE